MPHPPVQELCDALACVLLRRELPAPSADYAQLLHEASRHGVHVLLSSLPAAYVPASARLLKMDLLTQGVAFERRWKTLNQALVRIAQTLDAAHVPYFLLKGAATAACYPKPSLRAPGDIDLYVPEACKDRAVGLLQAQGFVAKEETMLHVTMSGAHEEAIELHRSLQRQQWPAHDAALRRFCDEAGEGKCIEVEGYAVRTLPTELELTMNVVHLLSHAYCTGFGLRHVCDFMMLLRRAVATGFDEALLERQLRATGSLRMFRALVYISNHYLHAEIPLPEDAAAARIVWRDVLRSGSFGRRSQAYKPHQSKCAYCVEFLCRCVRNFPLSPGESVAWPFMKLGRALRDEAHHKM